MKNSLRYGNKLPMSVYGHGKIDHDVSGEVSLNLFAWIGILIIYFIIFLNLKSIALVLRYGKPRLEDIPIPKNCACCSEKKGGIIRRENNESSS